MDSRAGGNDGVCVSTRPPGEGPGVRANPRPTYPKILSILSIDVKARPPPGEGPGVRANPRPTYLKILSILSIDVKARPPPGEGLG